MRIDFHTHTTLSDGMLKPEQLIEKALRSGVGMLAITDHNNATEAARYQPACPGIRLVQGSEISCLYTASDGSVHEVHVVALGFDPGHSAIRALFRQNRLDRRPYIQAILDKLAAHGIHVGSYADLEAAADGSQHFGRMLIAQRMAAMGYVAGVREAFDRYLGAQGERRAYVPNPLRYVSLEQAVAGILEAGGIPVLAHLYYYRLTDSENRRLVAYFSGLARGRGAMEVEYGFYTRAQRDALGALADEWGLLHSGGSDYHGQDPAETLENAPDASCCAQLVRLLA